MTDKNGDAFIVTVKNDTRKRPQKIKIKHRNDYHEVDFPTKSEKKIPHTPPLRLKNNEALQIFGVEKNLMEENLSFQLGPHIDHIAFQLRQISEEGDHSQRIKWELKIREVECQWDDVRPRGVNVTVGDPE